MNKKYNELRKEELVRYLDLCDKFFNSVGVDKYRNDAELSVYGRLLEYAKLKNDERSKHSTWTSVKDEMPKELVPVLVSDGVGVWSAKLVMVGLRPYWVCHGFLGHEMEEEFCTITHWMELPEAPKE